MSDTERTDMPRFGTNGNDYLEAKTGWWFFGSYEEVLYGYGGDDTLDGGNRNDTLFGGDGYDILTGGEGADYFIFNSPWQGVDTITDFNRIAGNSPSLYGWG